MSEKEFEVNSLEIACSDLKIVFITDEKMAATGTTGVHMHSFWEIFSITEGKLTVTAEKDSFELCEGDLLIVPPGFYHSSHSDENAVKRSVFFTFEKTKNKDDEEPLFTKVSAIFGTSFHLLKNDAYLSSLLFRISDGFSYDTIAKDFRIRMAIGELIFYIYDLIKNKALPSASGEALENSYWVYKYAIDRLLDIYYMTDISLTELSAKIYASPKNVSRIISLAYGKNFNELKLELKMRNAKKMLRETKLTVSEIAERTGYTTNRGFLAAFSKYEGMTPREYRKGFCQN